MHQNVRLQIGEQLDFATILYHKGLVQPKPETSGKAKAMAFLNEEKTWHMEIIELEKVIESQYITRSISNRADALAIEAKNVSRLNVITSKLSNLSFCNCMVFFLKRGLCQNDEEYQEITHYFNAHLPKFKPEEMGFREKLWWYKAHLWYSFLIQDFLSCYRYAWNGPICSMKIRRWLFWTPFFHPGETVFIGGLVFLYKDVPRFKEALEKFEPLEDANFPVRENVQSLAFFTAIPINWICISWKGPFTKG